MAGKGGAMSVADRAIRVLMGRADTARTDTEGTTVTVRVADGAMAGDRVPSSEFSDQDLV
jgi:hypothetical protein